MEEIWKVKRNTFLKEGVFKCYLVYKLKDKSKEDNFGNRFISEKFKTEDEAIRTVTLLNCHEERKKFCENELLKLLKRCNEDITGILYEFDYCSTSSALIKIFYTYGRTRFIHIGYVPFGGMVKDIVAAATTK